ncbi:MAG: DUF2793 domain-containing protein [Ahrensia sp.]|nr:DUF2793 domain-containing protein [Ahrensia sp.]
MASDPNTETPVLKLPYLLAAQAQKHVTHNEALRQLDCLVQASAKDRNRSEPPVSPNEGDCHIVSPVATGGWAGQDNAIAAFQDGAWVFHLPQEGWRIWMESETALLVWSNDAWTDAAQDTTIENADVLGVNTTADSTNRLSVKSDATLLSHDDITPGSGDHRVAINKAASARTSSLVFQNAFSGRAEFGLLGDDDWSVKVSANGSSWNTAMNIDGSSGLTSFPHGLSASGSLTCVNPEEGEYPTRLNLPDGLSQSQGTLPFGYPGYGGVLTLNITANRCFQWFVDGTSGRFFVRVNHISQPDSNSDWSNWSALWGEAHQGAGTGMVTDRVPVETLSALTPASAVSAMAGAIRLAQNATGGPVLVFSDGSNWLRSTDRTIVD